MKSLGGLYLQGKDKINSQGSGKKRVISSSHLLSEKDNEVFSQKKSNKPSIGSPFYYLTETTKFHFNSVLLAIASLFLV